MKEKVKKIHLNKSKNKNSIINDSLNEKERIIEIEYIDDFDFKNDEIKSLSFEYMKESYSE